MKWATFKTTDGTKAFVNINTCIAFKFTQGELIFDGPSGTVTWSVNYAWTKEERNYFIVEFQKFLRKESLAVFDFDDCYSHFKGDKISLGSGKIRELIFEELSERNNLLLLDECDDETQDEIEEAIEKIIEENR